MWTPPFLVGAQYVCAWTFYKASNKIIHAHKKKKKKEWDALGERSFLKLLYISENLESNTNTYRPSAKNGGDLYFLFQALRNFCQVTNQLIDCQVDVSSHNQLIEQSQWPLITKNTYLKKWVQKINEANKQKP